MYWVLLVSDESFCWWTVQRRVIASRRLPHPWILVVSHEFISWWTFQRGSSSFNTACVSGLLRLLMFCWWTLEKEGKTSKKACASEGTGVFS